MSRGVGSWWWGCRNCGHEHRISNLGRRRAVDHHGVVVHTTVHEANCYGWELLGAMDWRWHALGNQVGD